MQHKRFLFLLFFSFFFLSSCIPSAPNADDNGSEGNTSGNLTVPGKCIKDNSQLFISNDREYCFAYPYGFYIDNAPTSDGTIVLHEVADALPSTYQEFLGTDETVEAFTAIPITLTIYDHQVENENYSIESFIQERINQISGAREIYRMDFELREEKSILVSTTSDIDNMLHVFVNHSNRYCHISFMPSFIGINGNEKEENLVKLFFTIVETFTFIQ